MVKDYILVGQDDTIKRTSREEWEAGILAAPEYFRNKLSFMSPEHHLVRNFVVTELPRFGKPLAPGYISEKLNLPLEQVKSILGELESAMVFLYRNALKEVEWAYPATAAQTPHHVAFSSGERLSAA